MAVCSPWAVGRAAGAHGVPEGKTWAKHVCLPFLREEHCGLRMLMPSLRGKSGICVASARAHDHPLPAPSSCREGMVTHSLHFPSGRAQDPSLHVPFGGTMSILSLHFFLREGPWLPGIHDLSKQRHMAPQPAFSPQGGHMATASPHFLLREGPWLSRTNDFSEERHMTPQPAFSPQGGHMASITPHFLLRESTRFLPD